MEHTAVIGLGANLGDRLAALAEALTRLQTGDTVVVGGVSPVYESEPWGVGPQPPFANAVDFSAKDMALPPCNS